MKEALKVREFPECKSKFDHGLNDHRGWRLKKFNSRRACIIRVYKKLRKRP